MSTRVKTATRGKRHKKMVIEKVEEEKTDFPPLLLDCFKTKAALAKVFYPFVLFIGISFIEILSFLQIVVMMLDLHMC